MRVNKEQGFPKQLEHFTALIENFWQYKRSEVLQFVSSNMDNDKEEKKVENTVLINLVLPKYF